MDVYHHLFVVFLLIVIQVCAQQYRNQGQYNSGRTNPPAQSSIYNTNRNAGSPFGSSNNNRSGAQNQQKSSQNQQSQSSVSCPEKIGRFPTKSCDGYIECNDGVGEEKTCPDGLYFNPDLSIFQYPCQYPNEVDCEGRDNNKAADATDECPRQFGYFRVGDDQNCGQFINCADGRGYVMDCPEGLAFNEETYRCDWADEVESCNVEVFLGFACPPEAKGLTSAGYKFYRSSDNCQKYFICINKSKPRLQYCGEDQAFNELINGCDGIENVTGCSGGGAANGGPQRHSGYQTTQLPTNNRYSSGGNRGSQYQNKGQQSRPTLTPNNNRNYNSNQYSRNRGTTQRFGDAYTTNRPYNQYRG